jgi:outer membrane lipoprotein-sorting protein
LRKKETREGFASSNKPLRRSMVDVKRMISLFSLGLLFLLPGHSPAQSSSPASNADLQKIITQLNTAATKFVSAQAEFTWEQYTAAVQESDVQSGTIYYERKKGVTSTAAHIKKDNGKDAPKIVVFEREEVQLYEPAINQLTILKAGANHSQVESFLTLGFGGSGTDLQANWKVSLLGTEKMSGVSVVKLDLVPLQTKVLDMFPHVTVWIDPTRGISYKQIFYEPGGDKRTATYTNIVYNQPIASDVFEIKTAPGTNRVVK